MTPTCTVAQVKWCPPACPLSGCDDQPCGDETHLDFSLLDHFTLKSVSGTWISSSMPAIEEEEGNLVSQPLSAQCFYREISDLSNVPFFPCTFDLTFKGHIV